MKIPITLTPSRLRVLLFIALALITLLGAGLFYLAYSKLDKTAEETGSQVASAREGQDAIQRLQNLQKDLESKRDDINRASQVVANSQNYAYQDRLVNDLTVYANRAKLSISNISFTTNQGESSASTEEGGAPTPGPKSATVDITLENPVNYRDLLNFLHYVEQNLTKLKVSKVTMTKSDNNGVTIDVLNLEVYLR